MLKLVKKMHQFVSDDDLTVEITISNEGSVTSIACCGNSSEYVIRGCSLVSKVKKFELQDVLDILDSFSSLDESLASFEVIPNQSIPKL